MREVIIPILTKNILPQYLVYVEGELLGVGCNMKDDGEFTTLAPWLDKLGDIHGGVSIETKKVSSVFQVKMPEREPVGSEQWAVVLKFKEKLQ